MTKYQIGQHTLVVVDGELYIKVVPQEVAGGGEPLEVSKKHKRKYLKREKAAGVVKTLKGSRKTRKWLTPEQKAEIRKDIAAGKSNEEIMEAYDIQYTTLYRLKANSGEPLKLSVHPRPYVCPDGHHFQSKFPLSHARCPDCHQLAKGLGTDPEVEEEN